MSDSAQYTYNIEHSRLIGLKVTDTTGLSNANYTRLTVNSINDAPEFISILPEETQHLIEIGDSLLFSIQASDPDNDDIYFKVPNDVIEGIQNKDQSVLTKHVKFDLPKFLEKVHLLFDERKEDLISTK